VPTLEEMTLSFEVQGIRRAAREARVQIRQRTNTGS
jgi:hypothetical protein